MNDSNFILPFEQPLQAIEDKIHKLQKETADRDKIEVLENELKAMIQKVYGNLTPWQRVQVARHPKRPYAPYYIETLFEDFQELHGDRCFSDDQALIGGTAFFQGRSVMLLSQQKGKNTKENLQRNFGMPNPEGYRKALRLIKLAEKFQLPIIAFIDTPGAYPGLGSEERHVAEAIAVNLREMSACTVPILSFVLGEGGSGGALGIGVANRIFMLENAYYSVISPEGCAAILWKDRAHAPEAAKALKISAQDLLDHGISDGTVQEPLGGAHCDPEAAAENLRNLLSKHLDELLQLSSEQLRSQRYEKFRQMGIFEEISLEDTSTKLPS